MTGKRSRAHGAPTLAAAVSAAALALFATRTAEARDPARAARLFAEGRSAMAARDYALACSRFSESESEDPREGTLINLALCEEALGKLAAARQFWQQAADFARALGDPRADYDGAELARIDDRVPRLTIRLAGDAPPDSVMARDGVDFGSGSYGVALPLEIGKHTITVRARGRRESVLVLDLAEGERREIVVAPGPALHLAQTETTPPPLAAPSAPAKPPGPPGPGALRTVGWIAAGLGVVGLGIGTGFGIHALDASAATSGHCDGDYCDATGAAARRDESTAATVASISLASGAALVTAGAAFRILSPSPEEAPYVRRRLAYLSLAAGGVGLAVGALFGVRAIASSRDSAAGCNGDLCDHQGAAARRDEIAAGDTSTAAFIAGGVLVAAGVLAWVTEPRRSATSTAARVLVTPTPAPGGGALSARLTF